MLKLYTNTYSQYKGIDQEYRIFKEDDKFVLIQDPVEWVNQETGEVMFSVPWEGGQTECIWEFRLHHLTDALNKIVELERESISRRVWENHYEYRKKYTEKFAICEDVTDDDLFI